MTESTENTKELWTGRNVSIGTYEHGFVVANLSKTPELNVKTGKPNTDAGRERRTSTTYHRTIVDALNNAATRVAKREATTLHEYVVVLRSIVNELKTALGV